MTQLRFLTVLVLAVLLAACGGSSGSSGTPGEPPPGPETPPPASDDLVDLVLAVCTDGAGNGVPSDITGMRFSERADAPETFASCFDPAL
ncbi:hypothetical protein K8B33_01520 [Alcanivorax sp. JB21]|uniref:hypothetical protein n=1 Tax=Alcanivorax limicola TaxID=2874102 RepID=UPI001CBF7A68|nr:hypothetical protein [Alcanivorax limicola]MBZ2187765.1 hypothetical protein [Alcanivorax limicola]